MLIGRMARGDGEPAGNEERSCRQAPHPPTPFTPAAEHHHAEPRVVSGCLRSRRLIRARRRENPASNTRPWQRHRPPRPVYPSGFNRVLPAAGFSLSELDDAGVDLDMAESLGLPVDAGRIGAYGPNVTVLRDFVRSSRQPL